MRHHLKLHFTSIVCHPTLIISNRSSLSLSRGISRTDRPLPFHKGWFIAMNSIIGLMKIYMEETPLIKFLCARKLNQDHVENLHCLIKAKHGADDYPTPQAYINVLRILAIFLQHLSISCR
jgi:hypothetical protein